MCSYHFSQVCPEYNRYKNIIFWFTRKQGCFHQFSVLTYALLCEPKWFNSLFDVFVLFLRRESLTSNRLYFCHIIWNVEHCHPKLKRKTSKKNNKKTHGTTCEIKWPCLTNQVIWVGTMTNRGVLTLSQANHGLRTQNTGCTMIKKTYPSSAISCTTRESVGGIRTLNETCRLQRNLIPSNSRWNTHLYLEYICTGKGMGTIRWYDI